MAITFHVTTKVRSAKGTTNHSYNAIATSTEQEWEFATEAAAWSCFTAEQQRAFITIGYTREVELWSYDPDERHSDNHGIQILAVSKDSEPTVPR